MRVVIVDDEPLARQRLRELLSDLPDIEVSGEAIDGPTAITTIDSRLAPIISCRATKRTSRTRRSMFAHPLRSPFYSSFQGHARSRSGRWMAPVPVGQGVFGLRFENRPVDIDDQLLTAVARTSGGRYFRATDVPALERITEEINWSPLCSAVLSRREESGERHTRPTHEPWIPTW